VELKLLPVIVTDVPTGPFAGENEVITGCACTAPVMQMEIITRICFKHGRLRACLEGRWNFLMQVRLMSDKNRE
jgi:hypothetical protein